MEMVVDRGCAAVFLAHKAGMACMLKLSQSLSFLHLANGGPFKPLSDWPQPAPEDCSDSSAALHCAAHEEIITWRDAHQQNGIIFSQLNVNEFF